MKGDPTKYPEWYKNYLRGIMQVESSGGNPDKFINPGSSATGMYQQLYKQVKDLPVMQGVDRQGFASDTALQNKVMGMRFLDDLPGVTGELRNARDLTERFAPQFGDKWNYRPDEVAAMTYFIGRQGTINYLNHLLKGGKPEDFKVSGNNMTVPKYMQVYNEGFGAVEEQPQERQISPELQNAIDIMKRDNRFGGRVLKKKNYGQNGMLVQKDPTLSEDPPEEGTITPQEVQARLAQLQNPDRLRSGDAPFRTIKQQKDVMAEPTDAQMLDAARMMPIVGEGIDVAEIAHAAATGKDFYGEDASPEELSALLAAGLLIPNVIEQPLRKGYRAIKQAIRGSDDAFDYGKASQRVMDDYGSSPEVEETISRLRSSIDDENEFTSNLIRLSEQSPNSTFTFNIRGAEDPEAIRKAVRNAEEAGLIRPGAINLESRTAKDLERAELQAMNQRVGTTENPQVYIMDDDGVSRPVSRAEFERMSSGEQKTLSASPEFQKNLSQYSDFGVTGGLPGLESRQSDFILNRGSMSADPIQQRARYRSEADESLYANQHNFLTYEQSPMIIESGGRGFAQTGDMTGVEGRRRARFEAPEYGKTPTQAQIRRGKQLDKSVPLESEYPEAVYMRRGINNTGSDEELIRKGIEDPSRVGDFRLGGKTKKRYGQNGMLVQKDPTLQQDPPQGTITPQEALMRALQPENQFRLRGGDAPFRPIKEQRDPVETLGKGIAEVVRMLPFAGEVIDTYELGKVAATGEDVYGEEQDPGLFAALTAAGYVIPNVLEKPLKSAWRAVKQFPSKMSKKEFRELMGPEKDQARANLIQGHLETYEQAGYKALQSGARPVNVRQLPSLMSGSKLENAVGKDGMIQVSQIENLINSKDISTVEKEALQEIMVTDRFKALRDAGGGSKVDYNSFRRLGSDAVTMRQGTGDATFFVDETDDYAYYGLDRLGDNIRWMKDKDGTVTARNNLIRTTDPELQSSEYGHFGNDVIGHYRTFDRADEPGVLYISELQSDPMQARGEAGQKRVGLDIREEGPTAKQANLIKNQDQFLISHILEQEATGADKLRFPTGETTSKIQGYGDTQVFIERAQRNLGIEESNLKNLMTEPGGSPSRLAQRVEGMGLSGVDPDKTLDFLGRVRAYRTRGGVPRDLASDPGIQYNQSIVEKFDNDALKLAYKEFKDQAAAAGQKLNVDAPGFEQAVQARANSIKTDIHTYSTHLETIKSRKEHLSRVNASTQATEGIMKGYDRLPKALKKHGLDATKVTDDAGNTWWEVDIPARLGEGVGEIRAYRKGGQVSDKIRVLKKEGKPQDQAVAIALAMKQKGQL